MSGYKTLKNTGFPQSSLFLQKVPTAQEKGSRLAYGLRGNVVYGESTYQDPDN